MRIVVERGDRRPSAGGSSGRSGASGARPRPSGARHLAAQGPAAHRPAGRLRGILLVIAAVFLLLLGQSANLQIRHGDQAIAQGRKQRIRTTQINPERGDLVDRNGVPLAMSVRSFRLVADAKQVSDLSQTSLRLSRVIGVDRLVLRERLSRDTHYVILARGINESLKRRIEALSIPALSFEDEPQRVYPAGELARSVLGKVTRVDNTGVSGLEKLYDTQLTGRPGEMLQERKPGGRSIPSSINRIIPAERGTTYVLTLDRALQYGVEGMLARQIADTGAKGGIVIVTDPRNGDILALANMAVNDQGYVVNTGHNAALVNVYEPGSVNKLITMSAALETGVVGPDTTLVVPDTLQVGDHRFKDDENHPTMVWTPRDILATSSNIGTIKIAKALGRDRLEKYLRAFGLGSRTSLGFPGESPGILVAKDNWSGTSIGSVPIGQGIAVTAMQMLQAYNTVAMGGRRIPVRLVRAMIDSVGREHEVPVGSGRRVVSEKTSSIVTGMLTEVVRTGTGKAAAVPGYSVAGKTGTAMKPNEGARGYKRGAYVSSFIGFFPAEKPRFSALVVLDEPKSSIYGGVVSAPLFAEIARFAGQHYRIPPSTGDAVDLSANKPTSAADHGLKSRELNAVQSQAADVQLRLRQAAVGDAPAAAAAPTAPAPAAPAPAAPATTIPVAPPTTKAQPRSTIPDVSPHTSATEPPRARSTWVATASTVAGSATAAATPDARVTAARPPATVVAN